jgi:DNA repair photolyase
MSKEQKRAFGTNEWASQTVNCISGCKNNCKYCYAKSMAIRFKRKTSGTWVSETVNFKKTNTKYRKRDGVIMFPSTHDITPSNLVHCLKVIKTLLKSGNELLIVTKPYLDVIKVLCDELVEYKEQILFRFTIGSTDNKTLKFWEPGAPSFGERLAALKHAFESGFNTSVSGEPLLDTNALELVETLSPYITGNIWLGLPNYLISRLSINGITDKKSVAIAKKLITDQSDEWVWEIYNELKDNPKVRWKESIRDIIFGK